MYNVHCLHTLASIPGQATLLMQRWGLKQHNEYTIVMINSALHSSSYKTIIIRRQNCTNSESIQNSNVQEVH